MFNIKALNKKTLETKPSEGNTTITSANNQPVSICLWEIKAGNVWGWQLLREEVVIEKNVLCHQRWPEFNTQTFSPWVRFRTWNWTELQGQGEGNTNSICLFTFLFILYFYFILLEMGPWIVWNLLWSTYSQQSSCFCCCDSWCEPSSPLILFDS